MWWFTISFARLRAQFRWLSITCVQFDQCYSVFKMITSILLCYWHERLYPKCYSFRKLINEYLQSQRFSIRAWKSPDFYFKRSGQHEAVYVLEENSCKCDSLISCHNYLKSQASCGWVSTVDDFPKQLSHTRTGAWPQPRSGTGFLLVEHASQTPPPQARQWCLVSLSAKRRRHDLHALKWM